MRHKKSHSEKAKKQFNLGGLGGAGGDSGDKPLDTANASKNLGDLLGDFGKDWRSKTPGYQNNYNNEFSGGYGGGYEAQPTSSAPKMIEFGDLFGAKGPTGVNRNLPVIRSVY